MDEQESKNATPTKWAKDEFGGFAKTAKFKPGQIVQLLLDAGETPDDVLGLAYNEFKLIAQQRTKAIQLSLISSALALLAYFNVVSSFSSAGFEISSEYLNHIALLLISVSSLYFASIETKFSFYTSWFEWMIENSEPSRKVFLLLRYPIAFDAFKYAQSSVGYPKGMHPKRQPQFLPFAFLTLIAVLLFVAGSIALFVLIGVEVWYSESPNSLTSKAVVVIAGLSSLISLMAPKHYNSRRKFIHYGLSNLMSRFRDNMPKRYEHYSKLVAKTRIRMGLIDVDDA